MHHQIQSELHHLIHPDLSNHQTEELDMYLEYLYHQELNLN